MVSTAGDSPRASCTAMVAAALLLASVLFVVGLFGPWGRAEFSIGGEVSGVGLFTLWKAKVTPTIDVIDIGLPPTTFDIDDSFCDNQRGALSGMDNVCGRFRAMRAFTAIALASTILATCCTTGGAMLGKRVPQWPIGGLLSAGVALLASAGGSCAVGALASAASLLRIEDNQYFKAERRPGFGSVSVALGGTCCVAATLAALVEMGSARLRLAWLRSSRGDSTSKRDFDGC